MRQVADLSFERIAREFAQWRAVPDRNRSAAPAWWWGPAFEARGDRQPRPSEWCAHLGLAEGSPVAAGADVLLKALADQTSLPWTGDFPFNQRPANPV